MAKKKTAKRAARKPRNDEAPVAVAEPPQEKAEPNIVPQVLKRPVCPGCGKNYGVPTERTIGDVQYRKCSHCGTKFKTVLQ